MGGQVGALRVLMGADWAQLQADMAKAKGVVAESRAEFALFGRAGKDAQRVLVDLGEGSEHTGRAARHMGSMLAHSMGGFNREGAIAVHLLTEGISGGIGKLTLAAGVAMAAVGFAVHRIEEAWKKSGEAEKEYLKASAEGLRKTMEERAEILDRRLGANWHKVAELAHEAEVAQAKAAESAKAFKDVGFLWNPMGDTRSDFKERMMKDAAAAEEAQRKLNAEVLKGLEDAREKAEKFHDELRKAAGDRDLQDSLKDMPEPFRRAFMDSVKYAAQLKEKIDGIVPSAERVERALKGVSPQERAEWDKKALEAEETRARLAEEAAAAAATKLDADQASAAETFTKPYRERAEKAKEALDAERSIGAMTTVEAAARADMVKLGERLATAHGMELQSLNDSLNALAEVVFFERARTAEKQRQKELEEALKKLMKDEEAIAQGIERAGKLRTENDRLALEAAGGLSAKEKELLDLRREREEELKKIPAGGGVIDTGALARGAVEEEYRRRELIIDQKYDRLAAEGDHASYVARRAEALKAAADELGDVRLQTEALLGEEDKRYEAEQERIRSELLEGRLSRQGAYAAEELALQAHESKLELIKAKGLKAERDRQVQEALGGDDIGAGFEARISQLRDETAGWGRLGAQMADVAVTNLSGGVAQALEDVARGTKTGSQAFREWAASFGFEVARMIEQALILKAILAIFPGLGGAGAGAAAAPAAGAQTGGSFRVPGFGGLDSQLAVMRVTPGELIRVTNPGEGGGVGPIHLTVINRPAAVVADTVAEKMSPEARGMIVATTLRRGGSRARRAPE